MVMVKVAGWERFGWLRHGFTTRLGGGTSVYGAEGELNLGLTREDEREIVLGNRARVVEALGGMRMDTVRQVHGTRVVLGGEGEADGMVTAEPGVVLGVMAADCVPVLVVDRRLRAVGAVHAGWRGTAAGLVGAGVEAMRREFGSRREDLMAAVGPSIGQCCYGVGEEVRDQFAADLFAGERLDLWEANRRQLVAAGVGEVAVVGECTRCTYLGSRRKYFSHRGDAGVTGRAMGCVAVMREL